MNFDSFSEFLAMGGHGLYVWSAYAIAVVVVMINFWQPYRSRRRFFADQARRLRREAVSASAAESNAPDSAPPESTTPELNTPESTTR